MSIHGGEVDEKLKISLYESSDESDAILEFKERQDVHESTQEEELYQIMLERYRPKNHFVSHHKIKNSTRVTSEADKLFGEE